MAASPAEASPLPFGCRLVAGGQGPGPASHDGTGQRHLLIPPAGDGHLYALDVEARALPVPEALRAALGPRAMARWGEIEVMAKLVDLPAHLMLRRVLAGEGPALIAAHGIEICRCDTPDFWRVIGRCPRRSGG